MDEKRGRRPAGKTAVKEEREDIKRVKRITPVKKISSGPFEKMERSEAALLSLNSGRKESEIWANVVPFKRRTTNEDFDPKRMYKFITWNVAGLRGMLKKDETALKKFLAAEQPDILCLQETKLNVGDAAANAKLGMVSDYTFVDHPCAYKKGYSGTRTYMRTSSMVDALGARCTRGFTLPSESTAADVKASLVEGAGDEEGRILTTFLSPKSSPLSSTAAAPRLAIVNTYVPNSGMTLDRLPLRIQSFDPLMRDYLQKLDDWSSPNGKASDGVGSTTADATLDVPPHGFIWAGDLNVAERDFDRYFSGTFKTMQECSGFTPEERSSFRETLAMTNAVDVFRHFYPNSGPAYTFWSMRMNARVRDLGWRLDYFVVSSRLLPYVVDCFPMPEVAKSDHCPVQMWMRKP